MGSAPSTTFHFTLMPKHVVFAFTVLAGLIAGPPAANYFNPNVRADGYTGTQGGAHEERTTALEDWQDGAELRLTAAEYAYGQCKVERDELRMDVDTHLLFSTERVNQIIGFQARTTEHIKYLDRTVNDCMKQTRVLLE